MDRTVWRCQIPTNFGFECPKKKISSRFQPKKPIVFISHMEHHSNQTSWLETIADVEVIPPSEDGLFSIENLELL
jgi:selenocysteine lyase/cysteine desulfurase